MKNVSASIVCFVHSASIVGIKKDDRRQYADADLLLVDFAFILILTHDKLEMLEIPCTQVGGQPKGRTRATFTSLCRYILHREETMVKTKATFTSYV
jgi:hypothetical protein